MSEAVVGLVSSVIVALISLAGVIFTQRTSHDKLQQELQTAQAVTDTKIEQLTKEVNEHNNFAHRVPVIEEQIKVINHRIEDLEDE